MAIQIRRGTNTEWESNNSNIVAGEPAVAMDSERMFVGTGSGTYMELANIDVLADPFDSSASYVVGDFTAYHGKLYKCNTDHSGAWNASNFDEVSLADALDALGDDVYTKAEADALLALKADKSDTYTKTEVDNALGLKADASSVYTKSEIDTELEDYAKVDGSYEGMTVGNAEQLIATQYVEDSEPYLFRTTGGSADVGNREYVDEIVGGTVVWNQLFQNGNFETTNNWRVYTSSNGQISASNNVLTITYSNAGVGGYAYGLIYTVPIAIKTNHVYMIKAEVNVDFDTLIAFEIGTGIRVNLPIQQNQWTEVALMGVRPSWNSGNTVILKPVSSTIIVGSTMKVRNYMLIDVTQMFGSAIAEYAYSLDFATLGTGVAWFKKLFPNDYYEYNSGELISVSDVSEHKMVGFNQWDEEWEQGSFNANGAPATSTQNIRSKNYIPVIPNTTYYGRTGNASWLTYFFYDADKNFVGTDIKKNNTFVTPSNAQYMRFRTETNVYGTTYKNDICINISWSGYRNGEYEPYVKHSYPLDDSLTLRGIPKLDSSNNLYYDGDTYEHDGTVTRKYGIVDLGTLTWTNNFENSVCGDLRSRPNSINLMSNSLVAVPSTMLNTEKPFNSVWCANDSYICVKVEGITASNAKTMLSGVYLVYELETPTTESAEPYQQVQICDEFGTEEFVSTSIVPVGHNTRYPDNLRDKLQHLPSLAGADGYYMISQQNNNMSLELFRIPKAPTTDGTYTLKATVSGGTPTYTWESEVEE